MKYSMPFVSRGLNLNVCLGSAESQEKRSELALQQQTSLQSVDSEQDAAAINVESGVRRHSNFTNSSLNHLPITIQTDIKPTGSLELGKLVSTVSIGDRNCVISS